MKRKFGQEETAPSIFGAPPLESTMLIDTGGIKTGDDCIGAFSTIPVNASMSSGTRLFQYNKFYWNRDLFTFNFNNCGIIIILSWWNGSEGSTNTMFFPVFLPQTALTTYQSLQSGVTFDPATKTRLINDLLYYLNGMWVSNPTTDSPPYWHPVPPYTGPLQAGPTFFTYHMKGFLFRPGTLHTIDFPFFNNGIPPLKWISINSNQNIALIKNPDYWYPVDSAPVTNYDCAFQLVNPYSGWTLSDGNPTTKIVFPDGNVGSVHDVNEIVPATFRNQGNSNHKGWCGRGAFSIGFSQGDDIHNPGAYTDIYGEYDNPVLQDLWINYTNFVGQEPAPKMTGLQWLEFVEGHFLSRYSVVAFFIPNFLPSRYVAIGSDIIARDQKMMSISNAPVLQKSNVIGVQYLTLDSVRTWQDATLSGTLPSNKAQGGIGGRTNGNDDTPVVHMNPLFSIQSLDFSLTDEFQAPIQNFRTAQNNFVLKFSPTYSPSGGLGSNVSGNFVCSYIGGENSFVLDNSTNVGNLTTFQIPSWLAALNPLNAFSSPPLSQQPLIGPFSNYNFQFGFMLFVVKDFTTSSGESPNYISLPIELSPSMPYSGNIIHFGRVLGY